MNELNDRNPAPDREDIAEVVIDGRVIPVAGGETAYLQKVAAYVDQKIAALKKTKQYGKQNRDLRNVMLWLNLADDCIRARENDFCIRGCTLLETDASACVGCMGLRMESIGYEMEIGRGDSPFMTARTYGTEL